MEGCSFGRAGGSAGILHTVVAGGRAVAEGSPVAEGSSAGGRVGAEQ